MKKCVVFSYGPVPSPDQDKVEGGGLRSWGLAKGLKERFGEDLEITVAYNESYKKENSVDEFEGIKLITWNLSTVQTIMTDFDSIVVSYCMGDLSVEVATKIRADQQLVLDCYVPIYVEISARQSDDLNGEYAAFANEVDRWAQVLKRGDIFLCANQNQKRFYQGVLAGLGRVNPATYSDNSILVVPYGVYKEKPQQKSKPIDALISKSGSDSKKYKKLLWFGGIYPWFDIKSLIKAVNEANKEVPVKLIIVGAKNPFNAHPDFVKSYDDMIAFIENDEENRNNVVLQDWVEFEDRANWYLDSDLVILINKIGEENELAWRTRLVDYIWADLPILTNAGDPLGEELVSANAAVRLTGLDVDSMSRNIITALKHEKNLSTIRKNVEKVRNKYYWDKVVEPLGENILKHTRPTDVSEFGLLEIIGQAGGSPSLVRRALRKAKKLPGYYKKYGLRNTYFNIRTMAVKRIPGRFSGTESPKVVFVAHQLDNTGAPHVFIDMIAKFRDRYPNVPVDFHTFNPANGDNIKKLNSLGLKPKIYVSNDIAINYSVGDTIVLNTVAYTDNVKQSLYEGLESNVINKLIWYVHEDEPSLIFKASELKRISDLMKKGKIEMFVMAEQTRDNYVNALGVSSNVRLEPYGLDFTDDWFVTRKESDFDDLRFILPGMMGDARKGQLPMAYAFIEFKRRYYDPNPNMYRNFSLTYVGVGADFPSRQLLKHTEKGLGDKFIALPPMSHESCLELIAKANITICYSIRESLPLYVYEGMSQGHPILRNDSSGMVEQLKEGLNGFFLDSTDLEQVVQTIEKIANKQTTSSKMLAKMSKESVAITKDVAAKGDYTAITKSIEQAYATYLNR